MEGGESAADQPKELAMNEPFLEIDRREHPRVQMTRPGKIFDPRSRKYLAAELRDISEGGMLLHLLSPLAIDPGDEIFVGLAEKRREPMLKRHEMIRSEVVRALGTPSGGMLLAVEFIDRDVADPSLVTLPHRRAA
ncbi:MAG: PilZ domain-containing protein [Phycisphaerales bacterium]|nr:MAG: PilZ domain-containing protein [Phycisphaerales bacterium]